MPSPATTPQTKSFPSGTFLFRENDRSRELYIIQSGNVKVFRDIGGKEVELAILGKGAVLGEMALIDGRPRSASARTLDPCTLTIINADGFLDRVKGVPPWFMTIIRMTCQKIRNGNRLLHASAGGECTGPNIILAFSCQFSRWGETLDTALTRKRLVNLLGVSEQAVTRIGEFLHASRFIVLEEETIRLFDRKRFSEYGDYLRNHIGKLYERTAEPLTNARNFVMAVARQFPDIVAGACEPGKVTEIEGERLAKITTALHLGKVFDELLVDLETAGLVKVERAAAVPQGAATVPGAAAPGAAEDDVSDLRSRSLDSLPPEVAAAVRSGLLDMSEAGLPEEEPAASPPSRGVPTVLRINNDMLKQWYLYYLYNGMKPCI